MLKGQVFSRQLFENQIFALFIDTFLNGVNGVSDNYKNGMEVTYSGSNVTVDSGAVCIQGRFLEEDTSTTINAGTDTMYCKLVIEIDLDKTNTESSFLQASYKVIKSGSDYPALTQNNIVKNNAGIYQYELARFKTSANGITDFEDKRTFLDFDSIYDEINAHIQAIDDGSAFVFKNQVAVVTGEIELEANIAEHVGNNEYKYTVKSVDYPTGFNKNNCVVISVGLIDNLYLSADNRGFSYGTRENNALDNMLVSSAPRNVMLRTDDMRLSVGNYNTSVHTYTYKITLLKVS